MSYKELKARLFATKKKQKKNKTKQNKNKKIKS